MEKIKQDYILLIMNCEKYRDKALAQKNGWLKQLPSNIIYFHILGNPELCEEYVFNHDERILWVKTMDDYNSLPKKVIASYYAINQYYDFKYIFKSDDDQTLLKLNFFKTLCNLLETKKPKYHYGGQLNKVTAPYLSMYNTIHPELPDNLIIQSTDYCSGRFYLLSPESIKYLISKRKMIEKEYLEDYAIGLNLNGIFKKDILYLKCDTIFKG